MSTRVCLQSIAIALAIVFLQISADFNVYAGQKKSSQAQSQKTRTVSSQIARVKGYQRKILEQMQESTKDIGLKLAETNVDAILDYGPGKTIAALRKIKKFYDVTRSVYETGEALDSGDKWLALSEALEGIVTLVNIPFELNPDLKSLPYYKYAKAADEAVSYIHKIEIAMEAQYTSRDTATQLENLKNLNQALMRMQEMASKPQTSVTEEGVKESPKSNKDQSRIASYQKSLELLNRVEHRIENISRDAGPIYLDYEGDGVRTETPPPGLQSEALQRWLEQHQDFLRFVKSETASSQGRQSPPTDLLKLGKEADLAAWLAKHPGFLNRILANDLPPELRNQAIELSDQQGTDPVSNTSWLD
jgi:hypothetical protein